MSSTRLLVTGGAGFLGSHFIRAWLASHPNDEIINLDQLTYAGSRGRLDDLASERRYRFVQGTICDPQAVRGALQGCTVVVHFAAETHVDRSITDASPFLQTNVQGTGVLLHEAVRGSVRRFVHISTDEVYGPILEGAVDETANLSPRSPYAASKAGADLLVQAYGATYGLPVIVVRPTNVFGPAQLPEKFIPLCIVNGLEGRPIPLYGDGQQRRAWLFVADLCDALILLTERGDTGQIYNIGSGHEQTNAETARAVCTLLGCSPDLIQHVQDRPAHDRRYAINDTRVCALGWKPARSFLQGLTETTEWFRSRVAWWRPLVEQLREDPYHWLNRSPGTGAHRSARTPR